MPRRILVVDDDAIMSQFVVMKLKGAGYDVSSAPDGELGLEAARQQKPDLMVLDLAMPRMHGYEVCKAIREDPELKDLKIIVTSGKNYPVDIKAAKKLGADRYLVKPYPIQELLEAVEVLLSVPPS